MLNFDLYFFSTETSTLNIFYQPSGSNRVLMATTTVDLPGPQLTIPNCNYPKVRMNPKYSIENCKHNFVHMVYKQLRRGDEAPTSIEQCTLCKSVRSKN